MEDAGPLRGEKHPGAKLTVAKVKKMRKLHAERGLGYWRLGKMFGVSPVTVQRVILRRAWAHVA